MLFTRAYVQVAVCMPSRNALLFSRRPDTAQAWSISETQWPRKCGGAACGGNVCGPTCGIREPGGKLAVSLPGWFYQHGFFTAGAGKIFHEGADTEEQDFAHSWTPSITNPSSGLYEGDSEPPPMYRGKVAQPSWYAFDVEDEEMKETQIADHVAGWISNLSKSATASEQEAASKPTPPFFVAAGFHKVRIMSRRVLVCVGDCLPD